MVQIIPREPSFAERIGGGLGAGIGGSLSQIPEEIMGRRERQQLSQLLGQDVSKIRNPELMKEFVHMGLLKKQKEQELASQLGTDKESVSAIEKFFGPNAAELYPYLTEGGKTELMRSLFLGKERGIDTNRIISEYMKEHPEQIQSQVVSEIGEEEPSVPEGLSFKAQEELRKEKIGKSEKYLEEAREKYQRAQQFKPVFAELRDTITQGGADAFSGGNLANIGSKMGGFLGGTLESIGKALESGETGKFKALSKRLLDEMKDIFGGQIRVKELEVFLSMLPEIGKSKEANMASLDVLERLSEASSMFYETAQEIIQENNGKIPTNLADRVQKKLGPVMSDIANQINFTTKGFEKSAKGKPLTQDIAKQLLQEAGGDRELARKLAKQRGYKF